MKMEVTTIWYELIDGRYKILAKDMQNNQWVYALDFNFMDVKDVCHMDDIIQSYQDVMMIDLVYWKPCNGHIPVVTKYTDNVKVPTGPSTLLLLCLMSASLVIGSLSLLHWWLS